MDTLEQKKINITIGIQDIKLIHFETSSRLLELKEPLPQEVFEFQFEMQARLLHLEKLYEVQMSATLFEKQSVVTKVELAKLKTLIAFRIDNYEEIILNNQDQVTIPDGLITLTASIALSTTRGMFAVSVKDLIIRNAIIPIMDPSVFLPKKNT